MSRPVAVDTTVNAMVALISRAAHEPEFRELCATDLPAALAELELELPDGESVEYRYEAGSHRVRVDRRGDATTLEITPEGGLRLDAEPFLPDPGETIEPEVDLTDEELAAVAGGYSPAQGATEECLTSAGHNDFSSPSGKCIYSSNSHCLAYAWRGPYVGLAFYVSCKEYGS